MNKERVYGAVNKDLIEALKYYELDPKTTMILEVTTDGIRVRLKDKRELMLRV